jgi:Carboxypeptidase regulatory-like domain/DNA circularisation protein N-terminus
MAKYEDDDPSKPLQELRALLTVRTSNERSIVEHKIPGKETSTLQDMGKHALRFGFLGEFMGKGATAATETLWEKFQKGKIVPFSSDLVGLSKVTKVLIERLEFEEIAGDSGRFRYRLLLREYTEPKEEEDAPSQEDEAKKNTDDETDKAEDSVNYVTGKVLDKEKKPVEGAKVVVKGDSGEFQVQTDENGVFRKDNLDPGKYTVTIDAAGYENQKREVEIKGGNGGASGSESGEAPSSEAGSQPAPSGGEQPGGTTADEGAAPEDEE